MLGFSLSPISFLPQTSISAHSGCSRGFVFVCLGISFIFWKHWGCVRLEQLHSPGFGHCFAVAVPQQLLPAPQEKGAPG